MSGLTSLLLDWSCIRCKVVSEVPKSRLLRLEISPIVQKAVGVSLAIGMNERRALV